MLAEFGRDLPKQVCRPADAGPVLDVALKLVAFCLLYVLGAALIWPATFYEMICIYFTELGLRGWTIFVFVLVPVAVVASPRKPMEFIVNLIRFSGPRIALVVAIFTLSLAAYTTYKLNIPNVVPFYSDRAMADLDDFFHGRAPWHIVHAFDSDALSWLIVQTYSRIWFFGWFAIVFLAALHANRPVHLRYLAALALTTLFVGTLLAMLFSSVGPIFYDQFLNDPRYADLLKALVQRPSNALVLNYSEYLLQSYKAGKFTLGSGISAMPSMHVAVATLNAFYLTRLNRWFGMAGWAFALLILFGSVYTGWHYAVDGYIAMLVATVIWQRTGKLFEDEAAAPRLPQEASLLPSPQA
ncbi:hypothetical protein D3227_38225 [Mesorhizobium waimense]|uniref:Inositolphosphotransferase Aur1/Ipt1 domain-containing protein n=1 Tax=Mesorhizobium waimense TaxID=1300307 RepID=A0A3A5JV16_9HYPH|nr:hypothetical protein D3227_38225 [Mesorhizobium waimense]